MNLDPLNAQTFDVLQNTDVPTFAPVTQVVVVPAMSLRQVALQPMKATVLQVVVTRRATTPAPRWVAYGSSVDNVAGDSWSSFAFTAAP